MPDMLSPRDLVFRPDIGHKLYNHQALICENVKTVDFSTIIAACELKVG